MGLINYCTRLVTVTAVVLGLHSSSIPLKIEQRNKRKTDSLGRIDERTALCCMAYIRHSRD